MRLRGSRVIQYRVCAIRRIWTGGEEEEIERKRNRVDARVTLLSRIEKNYHIMQIRARAQNTSGSARRGATRCNGSPHGLRARAVAGGTFG
jgi:hypothetical protein